MGSHYYVEGDAGQEGLLTDGVAFIRGRREAGTNGQESIRLALYCGRLTINTGLIQEGTEGTSFSSAAYCCYYYYW